MMGRDAPTRPKGRAMARINLRLGASWAATAVLLALCLWPKSRMPVSERSHGSVPHADKLVHFAMFGAFASAWMWSAPLTTRRAARRTVVLVAAAALAVSTELAQGLPAIARDPDAYDALADLVGAVAGVAFASALPERRERPPSQ
jgi:VanZ family protein